MTNKGNLKAAKKKVAAKKGFYWHLIYYGLMSALFIILNLTHTPERIWFFYPMLGWGIGLVSHYIGVFGLPGNWLGKNWEQKQIEIELDKLDAEADYFSLPDLQENEEEMELKELQKNYDENDLV